jgi:hypothetical protein
MGPDKFDYGIERRKHEYDAVYGGVEALKSGSIETATAGRLPIGGNARSLGDVTVGAIAAEGIVKPQPGCGAT